MSNYYICIHGFGANKHSFDMLKLALLEKDPTSIILTPELLWHGEQSSKLSTRQSDRNFTNYLEDIENKIDTILYTYHIKQFTLIGHSLWWAIGIHLATNSKYNNKISRCILLNPALYKPKSLWLYKYFDQINTYFSKKPKILQSLTIIASQIYKLSFPKNIFKTWLSKAIKSRYRNYIAKPNIYTNYVQHFYAEQAKNPRFLQYFWLSAINFLHEHVDFQDIINAISCDTLLVHGDKDKRFRSETIMKLCSWNRYIQFEKLNKLGHNPHEEDPYLIAHRIIEFIQK